MCKEEIIVNKLDRPPLQNNEKIHGPEKFQIRQGVQLYLTKSEEQILRDKLIRQENNIEKTRVFRFGNYFIVLSLFILFSIAFTVAIIGVFINSVQDGNSNIIAVFEAWVFLEMILLIPFILYLKYHGNYKKASKYGTMKVYQFVIEKKLIHEYYDDFHTFDHYIVIGNAYVQIGKNKYDRLQIGDRVQIAVFIYKGSTYFSLLFWY